MAYYEHPNPQRQASIQRLNDLRAERNRNGILPQHDAAELDRLERELSAPLPRRTQAGSAGPLVLDTPQREYEPSAELTLRQHAEPVQNFTGWRNGKSPQERAHAAGMWFLARASVDLPGRYSFPAAVEWCQQNLAAMGENTVGGHSVVPDVLETDIIDLKESYGVARRLFKRREMRSDVRKDPRRDSGLTAYWVGEGAAGTESTKAFGIVQLTAKKLMVLSRYSNELSEDAVISIGDDLAGEIAYAFASAEDDAAFNGDGTSTYGRITGVRQALQTAAGSPTTTSAGGIIVGAGNAYSELTLANFHSVLGILPQYADTPNTTWLVHRVFYHDVMQRLIFAQGGVEAREVAGGVGVPKFLSIPVTFSQKMPSTAANSQVCCLLGDFTLGASFGDRRQDTIQFSEEAYVNGQSLWERDQVGIRGTERIDINVYGVGNTTTAGPIVGLQTLNS